MAAVIAHRGPDDASSMASGEAALAFRRLAIIDLERGRQPIPNEDGRYTLVLNGEIYNYQELTRELEERGHRFRTRCDAEVVVHLYEERGVDCVQALEGMFAFAIWDREERVLFMARDRMGKKPLFWAQVADSFLFGSELKALMQETAFERRLDRRAVVEYLACRYVPAPRTIFEGASKLEPASWMRVQFGRNGGGPEIRSQRYWTLHYEPKSDMPAGEAREQVRVLLERAVARRLRSDVPLGILLSGGVDSSSIVAMARRHVGDRLRTFSIGFRESKFNELPYARQVAQQFETEHEEFVVRPEVLKSLTKIVWHADEPFADASLFPTYALAELTAQHVKVAFGGDGGDESFVGYGRYDSTRRRSAFSRVPRVLREGVVKPMIRFARDRAPDSPFLIDMEWLNQRSLYSLEERYSVWPRSFHTTFLEMIVGPSCEFLSPSPGERIAAAMRDSDARDGVDRRMACDVAALLPGDLLVKIDRMAMAHGLEIRCPFLDRELMEFAARLPVAIKFPGRQLKGLLKQAMEPLLPGDLLNRPKQGLGAPLGKWFRGELKSLPEAILLSEKARSRGIFQVEGVRKLIDQHYKGAFGHAHRLWTLIAFEIWAQTFLDPPIAPTGPMSALEI